MNQEQFAQELLTDLFSRFPLPERPTIVWKNLRVTAGVAYYHQNVIALSRIVLDDAEKLTLTLKHEYAHLLAFARAGRKGLGHGNAWKTAMIELGLEPKVHHTYEVQRNNKRQRVEYKCARCGVLIQRARRLPQRRRYVHANCGGGLVLSSITRTPSP